MNANSDPTAGLEVVQVPPPNSVVFFKRKVMLALPWQKSTHPVTAFSVAQLMDRRRVTVALNFGDAFVAHSRNSIADIFLRSECEHLLMVDDDMVIPFGHSEWFRTHTGWASYPEPFASLNAVDRLLSHNKTIVGALYKGRYSGANYVYGEGNQPHEKERVDRGPVDEIRPSRWCGTGCLMIHRSVFVDIEKSFPLLARRPDGKGGNYFSSSEHSLLDAVARTRKMLSEGRMDGEKALKAYEMLTAAEQDAKANSRLGMGEDVQFCTRAKQAGHTTWIDFGLRAGHIGHKVF